MMCQRFFKHDPLCIALGLFAAPHFSSQVVPLWPIVLYLVQRVLCFGRPVPL
uniref:Uncharacterized protein n=1 Tax=Arundo donax TaxID=35708 RepID=A0A0A9A0X3_ARUDO